jgi:hypothetical protein
MRKLPGVIVECNVVIDVSAAAGAAQLLAFVLSTAPEHGR